MVAQCGCIMTYNDEKFKKIIFDNFKKLIYSSFKEGWEKANNRKFLWNDKLYEDSDIKKIFDMFFEE